jgi:hypothetical protein
MPAAMRERRTEVLEHHLVWDVPAMTARRVIRVKAPGARHGAQNSPDQLQQA